MLRSAFVVTAALFASPVLADQDPQGGANQDLTKLGLEDLMKIEVTTASKQAQELAKVPAAIYVVTQERIRRAGAHNIPEALRMVPGVQVAQIDANKWMISIRGFNSRFANKLLVMIDGRSVYTPLFSGVLWDAQEVNIDDVDRIEVIRGPGGTLWGANAVNGIINIITKNSSETQGGSLTARTSSNEPALGSIRYGGQLAPDAFYRVYAKYLEVDQFETAFGTEGSDHWEAITGGFRTDWSTKSDSFMVSGGFGSAHQGQTSLFPTFTPPFATLADSRFPTSNWNLLARWEKTDGPNKGMALRFSFDSSDREGAEASEKRRTFDIDFQQPLTLSEKSRLIWGLGYRNTKDDTEGSSVAVFDPAEREDRVFSGFLHTEFDLRPNVVFSLGTKVENNSYTGWEFQPSARVAWSKSNTETFWASVTRAVRTPSRADADSIIFPAVVPTEFGPVEIRLMGNDDFKSETVLAHEIGWRGAPNDQTFLDITAFYNKYENLRSFRALEPFLEALPFPHLVQPYEYSNGLNAVTTGVEAALDFKAAPNWRLLFTGSLFWADFTFKDEPDFFGLLGGEREGTTPTQQFTIQSLLDISPKLQLDASFYYVGKLDYENVAPYGRLDLRLGYRPQADLELSLGVQNLLNEKHREAFPVLFEVPSNIGRSFFAQVTWKF